MTKEKETIINGIDVSECKHHYTNPVNGTIYHGCAIYEQINELGYSQDTLCEQNPDCYFKKLKRLQEENEKQKEQIKQLEDFIKSDGEIDHINHEYTYKLKKVLQEVKSIARGIRSYLEIPEPRDVRFEMDRILDLITGIELPDQKESEKE